MRGMEKDFIPWVSLQRGGGLIQLIIYPHSASQQHTQQSGLDEKARSLPFPQLEVVPEQGSCLPGQALPFLPRPGQLGPATPAWSQNLVQL